MVQYLGMERGDKQQAFCLLLARIDGMKGNLRILQIKQTIALVRDHTFVEQKLDFQLIDTIPWIWNLELIHLKINSYMDLVSQTKCSVCKIVKLNVPSVRL